MVWTKINKPFNNIIEATEEYFWKLTPEQFAYELFFVQKEDSKKYLEYLKGDIYYSNRVMDCLNEIFDESKFSHKSKSELIEKLKSA